MSVDRAEASFAEREGRSPYPKLLEWGVLDKRLRSRIWNSFDERQRIVQSGDVIIIEGIIHGLGPIPWFNVIEDYLKDSKYEFWDDASSIAGSEEKRLLWLKNLIENSSYFEVFDFLEFL
jgi:hypothetical protein